MGDVHDATVDCPAGSGADAAREARLRSMLAAEVVPDAALGVCFTTDAVEAGGVLLLGASGPRAMLPGASEDEALAARLAHLGLHVDEPPFELPSEPGALSCARALTRAAVREAKATLLEHRILARLGRGSPSTAESSVALRGYLARCRTG
jgi:hypothetical protein